MSDARVPWFPTPAKRTTDERPRQLRLALTIPGAVSLGAFEAGALAALLVAVRRLVHDKEPGRPAPVVIDAVAAASAGSLTGLLAVWSLLRGAEPVDLMWKAWVELPALANMSRTWSAPLSDKRVRERALEFFSAKPQKPTQAAPVRISMSLCCLRGLQYRLPRPASDTEVDAITYLDWGEFQFSRGDEPERYTEKAAGDEYEAPIDFALASAANAMGFLPKKLRRPPGPYKQNGLRNFPQTGYLWYTDGGTVQNEPLGRAIDVASEIDAADDDADVPFRRLHLLIHPDPVAPIDPQDPTWAWSDGQPTFADALKRAATALVTQSVYDDFRHLEKTNKRLKQLADLAQGLAQILDRCDDGSVPASLEGLWHEIVAEDSGTGLVDSFGGGGTADRTSRLLAALIAEAAGLSGKNDVRVEVVSPLLDPETPPHKTPVEYRLAGDFLFHFGGFLGRTLRESDFALGYRSMCEWIKTVLARDAEAFGLTAVEVDEARDAVMHPPPPYGWLATAGSDGYPLGRRGLWSTLLHARGRELLAMLLFPPRLAVVALKNLRPGIRTARTSR